jgi:DNA-binding MarR family transcriptional regulator
LADAERQQKWTLLTSHGRVLLLIARNPELRVREIAEQARITERAASGITSDLEAAGYLTKRRQGRRTTYVVHPDAAFRHPAEGGHRVSELIEVFRS